MQDAKWRGITDADLKVIMNALNNRPRRSLGYSTPNEIFSKTISVDTLKEIR